MRAVIVKALGGVEMLELAEVPDPVPGPEDLLVRNFATALNRADLLQRRGLYPPPPGESELLGLEFAGEVLEAGAAAPGFARGERVFGLLGGGGYAELVRVHHRLAVRIPDTLSFDAAAAVPEVFYTANECLFTLGRLAAGETALIHAGASGVGTAAIQLARAAGARVLATAGSPEKLERCRRLGAELAIAYRTEEFAEAVRRATTGEGADVILDLVGAKHWQPNLAALRSGGRLIVAGLLGGAQVSLDLGLVLRRRLQIIGTAMRGRSLDDKIAITERFKERVLPLIERGEVLPVIDSVRPLDEVWAAHERMEANLNIGKIVLRL
jgi:tumor protein p53-inducible protein 3